MTRINFWPFNNTEHDQIVNELGIAAERTQNRSLKAKSKEKFEKEIESFRMAFDEHCKSTLNINTADQSITQTMARRYFNQSQRNWTSPVFELIKDVNESNQYFVYCGDVANNPYPQVANVIRSRNYVSCNADDKISKDSVEIVSERLGFKPLKWIILGTTDRAYCSCAIRTLARTSSGNLDGFNGKDVKYIQRAVEGKKFVPTSSNLY
ncbi:MAG: hypothetical protein JHC93_08125 [Parachlamydiales bacterium]|nr:hypothetical protein [Parachlamydiales bacterium]